MYGWVEPQKYRPEYIPTNCKVMWILYHQQSLLFIYDFSFIIRVTFSETPPIFSKPKKTLMINKNDWDSVWEEHFPDEDEKVLKQFFIKSLSETCRAKLGEEFAKTKAEVDSLHSTNKELLERQEKLADILKNIDLNNIAVQNSKDLLKDTEQYVRKCNEIQSKEFSRENVDEVVEIEPSHKTLLELIVVDEALKDTIYALGHLLNEGTISLEVYLKKIRDLSRKQFVVRQKITLYYSL